MNHADELRQITRKAMVVYRIKQGLEGGVVVGIFAAAATFVTLLLQGTGLVPVGIWEMVAAASGVSLALGVAAGALRPLDEARVLRRVDRDHRLHDALSTAWEYTTSPGELTGLKLAHVRNAVARARKLSFVRAVPTNLGVPARILGILCCCILSVALI